MRFARLSEKPGELNIDRVNAQQARRFMDRAGLHAQVAVEENWSVAFPLDVYSR